MSRPLEEIRCSICEQGVLLLFPNEAGRCPTCGSWISNGEITEDAS